MPGLFSAPSGCCCDDTSCSTCSPPFGDDFQVTIGSITELGTCPPGECTPKLTGLFVVSLLEPGGCFWYLVNETPDDCIKLVTVSVTVYLDPVFLDYLIECRVLHSTTYGTFGGNSGIEFIYHKTLGPALPDCSSFNETLTLTSVSPYGLGLGYACVNPSGTITVTV